MIRLHFTDGTTLDVQGKTLASVTFLPDDAPAAPTPALSTEDGRSVTLTGKPRKPHRRAPVPGTQRYDVLAWFAHGGCEARTAHECADALGVSPAVVTGQLSGLCKAGYLVRTEKVPGAMPNTYRTRFAITDTGRDAVSA